MWDLKTHQFGPSVAEVLCTNAIAQIFLDSQSVDRILKTLSDQRSFHSCRQIENCNLKHQIIPDNNAAQPSNVKFLFNLSFLRVPLFEVETLRIDCNKRWKNSCDWPLESTDFHTYLAKPHAVYSSLLHKVRSHSCWNSDNLESAQNSHGWMIQFWNWSKNVPWKSKCDAFSRHGGRHFVFRLFRKFIHKQNRESKAALSKC